ncbi:hypothetical protein D3C76_926890 [compost metagenome]
MGSTAGLGVGSTCGIRDSSIGMGCVLCNVRRIFYKRGSWKSDGHAAIHYGNRPIDQHDDQRLYGRALGLECPLPDWGNCSYCGTNTCASVTGTKAGKTAKCHTDQGAGWCRKGTFAGKSITVVCAGALCAIYNDVRIYSEPGAEYRSKQRKLGLANTRFYDSACHRNALRLTSVWRAAG